MTRTELNTEIDTLVGSKTAPDSLTPVNEADALKAVADYADQEVNKGLLIKIAQSGLTDPTFTTIYNKTGISFTMTRIGAGYYRLTPSETLTGNFRVRIDYQNDSFPVPSWEISNLGLFIDIKTRYRQSSTSSPLADEIINGAFLEIQFYG